ncbi:MAG: hypothetical protein M1832_006154 [Thelocarpon impressellum]|nr:MAG: hypothetical protein M1832_006154 [Thelocarpon impressellum]
MSSECKKAGKILASFVDPRQSFGPDKIIPPDILANSKVHGTSFQMYSSSSLIMFQGLAIITVLKVGFVGSARTGSGVVVARLPDGSWSAPSAIACAGAGFGGQIGLEVTDFVFILNDAAALRSFSQQGSITLGGNVSIAAGPVGRTVEAAGAASMKGVAGIFSYSKTKGLFAGVSLEGSVLVERRDANRKLYNSTLTARDLLTGLVPAPPSAEPLMRVLNSKVFAGVVRPGASDDMYNDVPVYDAHHDNVVWEGKQRKGHGQGASRDRTGSLGDSFGRPKRASTWQDDQYDREPTSETGISRAATARHFDERRSRDDDYVYSDAKPKPSRPTAPKPKFGYGDKKDKLGPNQAIALFAFDADQPGDLGFKKGDIIDILKKTESANDWWTGRIGEKEGIFPSNYVDVI